MFDGTAYCGFQSQKNGRSVQETLTRVMSALFHTECAVTGCSRTDAGVHALGYCATVVPVEAGTTVENAENARNPLFSIPLERLARASEKLTPPDVAICGAAWVEDSFHPRYDVVSKEYVYKISDAPYRNPFDAGRVWQLKKPVSEDGLRRMQEAAEHIRGYRDYASFMASGSKITDARRNVLFCRIDRTSDGFLTLRIAADGFLYNMVRIITGTLIDTAYGVFSPAQMEEILNAKNRQVAGRTAPAHGLYLSEVRYREPVRWVEQR